MSINSIVKDFSSLFIPIREIQNVEEEDGRRDPICLELSQAEEEVERCTSTVPFQQDEKEFEEYVLPTIKKGKVIQLPRSFSVSEAKSQEVDFVKKHSRSDQSKKTLQFKRMKRIKDPLPAIQEKERAELDSRIRSAASIGLSTASPNFYRSDSASTLSTPGVFTPSPGFSPSPQLFSDIPPPQFHWDEIENREMLD